jgi:hypothetical protein
LPWGEPKLQSNPKIRVFASPQKALTEIKVEFSTLISKPLERF